MMMVSTLRDDLSSVNILSSGVISFRL